MAYLPLSTANLPDPAIDPAQGSSPEDYFNTVLYTGTGSDQSITGVGFQPDWTWLKMRSSTGSHGLFDAVRGATRRLSSNLTASEDGAAGVNSFDSDGFTLDALNWNNSGGTFVAWNWKANGSGVSNNVGSITSTVSANTESGFSIVKWTGDGTVGHGLDQAPEMFIVKITNTAGSWWVWHKDLSNTSAGYLQLNNTNSEGSNTSVWRNAYPATATTIDVNTSYLNYSTDNYIAYCFHSVDGFSKLGSYTGNGSTDGSFIYTGFRPSFVLIKGSTVGSNWTIYDNKRDTSNTTTQNLRPNTSGAETTDHDIDILSNGFKNRGTGSGGNASGQTYIYACFSENPFKYSNAR